MLKKFIEFILFGSIFIAFCAVGMSIETNLLLHLPLNNIGFYSFVFGATVVQYNVHYLLKKTAVINSERLAWSKQNKITHKILIVAGLILVLAGVVTFHINHLIFLFFLGIITLFYSVPVLPFKNRKRIKDFGILKIITLVLLWTLVTVWFPVQQIDFATPAFQLIFIRRFIFIFVLCLMFDIRDIEIDSKENIKTLPVLIGIKRSFIIVYTLIITFVILSLIQYSRAADLLKLNAMIISAAATLFTIEFAKRKNSDFVYLACIDGMMLLQALLVLIGSV